MFNTISYFSRTRDDCNFDVGDFDNDGAVDMVTGYAGFVTNYNPIDILYFRYDPGSPNNFSENWLITGLPLSCVTPRIADLDNDGQNEFFAGGLYPNGGSAFVWEGTGFQTGYVAWLDTVNLPNGPNNNCFGYVDGNPSVLAVHILPVYPTGSKLALWSFQNGSYTYAWESPDVDSAFYNAPHIFDVDEDGKQSLIVADDIQHVVTDWEQTSAGIWGDQPAPVIQSFRLYPPYPNPFNSATEIQFSLPQSGLVELTVFNLRGQQVTRLLNGRLEAGLHKVEWDAGGFSSGLYLYRLNTDLGQVSGKLMLVK